MNKRAVSFCLSLCALAVAGCQPEGDLYAPEVIDVSTQIGGDTTYNIDLKRDDAIFHIAPGLDAHGLSVTCPTGPIMSFADYLDIRVLPTGAGYDPELEHLFLANGELPDDFWIPELHPLATTAEMCWYCKDDGGYEDCKQAPCPPL